MLTQPSVSVVINRDPVWFTAQIVGQVFWRSGFQSLLIPGNSSEAAIGNHFLEDVAYMENHVRVTTNQKQLDDT